MASSPPPRSVNPPRYGDTYVTFLLSQIDLTLTLLRMLRSKKDVDRHVEQLEAKIQSEAERNLKAFTVAKLYFNVGEYETARRYLQKYLSVRENSSMALKLHGQVWEALQSKEKALKSYQKAYELDASQREVLIKICEILASTGINIEKERAR